MDSWAACLSLGAGDVGTITLEASRRNLNDLQTKVHRSPHFDHSLSLTANILHVERELVSCRDFENKRRLDKWRVRVQDDKQAFKWLRKQTGHLSHAVKSSSQDSVAASPQEALVKLKNQWARQPNDVEAAWRSAARSLPEQSRQEARLPALTKEELRKAVLDCKGTAPGIDGWTPREASWFSEDMLQVLTDFCNRCEQEGRVPKIWKVSRQVHLSKGKEPEPDGSLLTSSLRPVSISCLFWRVYTKARFKNTVVQNWIEAVFPSCVYGGIPKKGVQDAAGQLLRCAHAGKYIGSLDLSSVFDLAEPRLAIRIMQHMGLDRRLTSLLQEVWGDQTRFLQFLGETYPQGVAVQHSLPQGDSFSMTAMACVILPAVLDIARQCSDTVQIVYADDRSFACDSARELKRVKTLWQQWAQILGLKENEDKAQYYHLQTKGRRKLVSVGLDPTKIRGSIKVLGYVFSGVLARKADAHETRRLDEARQRASKCACLPGTLKRKIRIAQLTVVPKAAWGWILRRPAKRDLTAIESVFRRLHKTQRQSSPFLYKIVRGHQWDLRFCAVHEVSSILHRLIARTGTVLRGFRGPKSGWLGALRKGLLDLGWSEDRTAWTWWHAGLNRGFSLDRRHASWEPKLQKLQHVLRESWRRALYYKWLSQDRVDSKLCFNRPYCENRLKDLRFLDLTSHEVAVVTGGVVSPAKYAVMLPSAPLSTRICPFCKREGADWEHVAWGCTQAHRPDDVRRDTCHDILQARLGWPSPDKLHSRRVLTWLAHVRRVCLEARHAHAH